jgi:hypothetical protein
MWEYIFLYSEELFTYKADMRHAQCLLKHVAEGLVKYQVGDSVQLWVFYITYLCAVEYILHTSISLYVWNM